MARSYKRTPSFSDYSPGRRIEKRLASKAVRNAEDVPDGRWYKKLYCSYNICDSFSAYWSKRDCYRRLGERRNRDRLRGHDVDSPEYISHGRLWKDPEFSWRKARSK